jgi:DNA-binding NarL/FixJ family response regulator
MTKPISVIVVDDNADFVSMLATLIDGESDMVCAGTLASADTLLETVVEIKPDVVLLDLTMPGRKPLDAVAEASQRVPDSRIIVLSGYDDQATVDRAVDQGAWGFVSKHGDVPDILRSIRAVAAAQMYLKPPAQ